MDALVGWSAGVAPIVLLLGGAWLGLKRTEQESAWERMRGPAILCCATQTQVGLYLWIAERVPQTGIAQNALENNETAVAVAGTAFFFGSLCLVLLLGFSLLLMRVWVKVGVGLAWITASLGIAMLFSVLSVPIA